ncbi:MAG: glycosyltransferase, partial [Gammaproteobacteria bacterium]|nr:glycosyltransferase [Gammaproteobacteria bacterium]
MKLTRVEPVKILIVHSTLHIGGAEEVTANLCRHIDRTRFDVKVCVLKENGIIGKKIEEEGTEVLVVPHHRSYKIDYFTSLKLRKIIIKNDIKLVHSHDVHAFTDCSLCKLTVSGLKLVHTFHYGNYPEREKKLRRLERLLWRVPDQLVSVSKKQKKGLQKLYGIPENRIKTLWNGVDLKVGSCTVQEINAYHKKGRIIIGSINTLIEQKGMEDLIEVARVLKQKATNDFVFIVAGDGPLRDELDKQLRDYGLEEHVIFLGWIKDASSVLMPYIDIFFQPSLWEAMSMVLLEA